MNNKRIYESIYIMKGTLQNEEYKKVLEDLKKQFENVEIRKIEELGIKNLAYEVQGNKTGYYIVIDFKSTNNEIINIQRYCRVNQEIIKFIILKKYSRRTK